MILSPKSHKRLKVCTNVTQENRNLSSQYENRSGFDGDISRIKYHRVTREIHKLKIPNMSTTKSCG